MTLKLISSLAECLNLKDASVGGRVLFGEAMSEDAPVFSAPVANDRREMLCK